MPASLTSKLVFYDVPASDPAASQKFYEALFGAGKIPRSPSKEEAYFLPISPDGIDLTLHRKREDQEPPDIPIAYFAVDNLAAASSELESLGGKVVHGPMELPLPTGRALELFKEAAKHAQQNVGNRLGEAVVMLDPAQNPLGLVQLEQPAARYFRAGAFRQPLRADQAAGLDRALELTA